MHVYIPYNKKVIFFHVHIYIQINIVGPLYFFLVLGLQNFSTMPVYLHLFLGSDVVSRQQDTCLISPFALTGTLTAKVVGAIDGPKDTRYGVLA